MAKLLLLFTCIVLLTGCDDCEGKYVSIAIDKPGDFIHVSLNVASFSKDSIMTTVIFTNNSSKAHILYKPFLPYQDFMEGVFSVMEKTSLTNLDFLEKRQERYLEDGPCAFVPFHIIPAIKKESLIELQPNESLTVVCNIANKFDFRAFLSKGVKEFVITYGFLNPAIVSGKQEMALDTVFKTYKPVYYYVGYGSLGYVDSRRLSFKVP